MVDGILTWVEQRTGLVSMTKDFLTEDVPGGASYWYAFGSATMFAMILQITTGIFLTFFYAPSAATASGGAAAPAPPVATASGGATAPAR